MGMWSNFISKIISYVHNLQQQYPTAIPFVIKYHKLKH